jgi:membrane fusion protein (multidrug efflux system)
MTLRAWIGSAILFIVIVGIGAGLATWKFRTIEQAIEEAKAMPEPMETVTVAKAREIEHRQSTTSIGTVMALRSTTLRNETAGTVKEVRLEPGQIVEQGAVLVALDVSVEEAELKAQEAQVALAEAVLSRMQQASQNNAVSAMEVDRARAERDVAMAQIARIKAIIARKTITAPFRARVGMADVHIGQYLVEGTQLTTLQGVDEAVHVDFTVSQVVAAALRVQEAVEIQTGEGNSVAGAIEAVDARIDPATRNAMVRARVENAGGRLAPGASVRVVVPIGPPRKVIVIPVSALRRGPQGDHVFVIEPDQADQPRARLQPVQSGTMLGDEIVILAGLTPGTMVAASGSFKLREGLLVAVADESSLPASAPQ